MGIQDNKKIVTVCLDGSYFLYVCIFSAVRDFSRFYKNDSEMLIKPAKEVDQSNLPDLLISDKFVKCLYNTVNKKCEHVNWIIEENCRQELSIADEIKIIFALDNPGKTFRHDLYPRYKAQRKIAPLQFNISKIKKFIVNVIFKDLEVESKFGYNIISVPNVEADDIIAVTVRNYIPSLLSTQNIKNLKTLIIASDRDYLQLQYPEKNAEKTDTPNIVDQVDIFNNKVISLCEKYTIDAPRKEKKEPGKEQEEQEQEDTYVKRKKMLLQKIIMGDGSDNIPAIAKKIGIKRAIRLSLNQDELKKLLTEDRCAYDQFILNKKLIDFSQIPENYVNDILNAISGLTNTHRIESNIELDFSGFDILEI